MNLALKYSQIASEVTTIQLESFLTFLSLSPHTFLLPSPSLTLVSRLSRLDSTLARVFWYSVHSTTHTAFTFIHTRCTRQLRPVQPAIREGLERTCSDSPLSTRLSSLSLSLFFEAPTSFSLSFALFLSVGRAQDFPGDSRSTASSREANSSACNST